MAVQLHRRDPFVVLGRADAGGLAAALPGAVSGPASCSYVLRVTLPPARSAARRSAVRAPGSP